MLCTSVEINYRSQFSSPMRFPGFWLPYPVMVLVVLIIFAHFGYIYHYAPTLLAQILFPIWNTVAGLFLRPPELRSNKALTSLQNLRAVNDGIRRVLPHLSRVFLPVFRRADCVVLSGAAGARPGHWQRGRRVVERCPMGYTALFTTFGIDSLCALFQSVVLPDLEGWLSFVSCAEWAMGLLWIMAPDIRAALRDRCGSARVAVEAPLRAREICMWPARRHAVRRGGKQDCTRINGVIGTGLVPAAHIGRRGCRRAFAVNGTGRLAHGGACGAGPTSSARQLQQVQQILRERAVEHQICEMGLLCLAEISSPLIYMLVVTLCRHQRAQSAHSGCRTISTSSRLCCFGQCCRIIMTSIAFAVIYRCRRGDVPVFAVLWELVRENYHSIGVVMLNNMLLTFSLWCSSVGTIRCSSVPSKLVSCNLHTTVRKILEFLHNNFYVKYFITSALTMPLDLKIIKYQFVLLHSQPRRPISNVDCWFTTLSSAARSCNTRSQRPTRTQCLIGT